MMRFKCE